MKTSEVIWPSMPISMFVQISPAFNYTIEYPWKEISRPHSSQFVAAPFLQFEPLIAGDFVSEWVVTKMKHQMPRLVFHPQRKTHDRLLHFHPCHAVSDNSLLFYALFHPGTDFTCLLKKDRRERSRDRVVLLRLYADDGADASVGGLGLGSLGAAALSSFIVGADSYMKFMF